MVISSQANTVFLVNVKRFLKVKKSVSLLTPACQQKSLLL